jgi:hypothetical protein
MSIPGVLDPDLTNMPTAIPYLYSDPANAARWKQDMTGDKLKVGLVWEGSWKFPLNRQRSCRLQDLEPLMNIKSIAWYSLQKEVSPGDLELLKKFELVDVGRQDENFSDTAAVIENLDLLISVDTAVPHLAGAMGKPVWLLLSFAPDWRWQLDRDKCPWFPTMRLFRQSRPGDWGPVVAAVYENLKIM